VDLSVERIGEMGVKDRVGKVLFMKQAHFHVAGAGRKPELKERLDAL
jgi:hypothetical protein